MQENENSTPADQPEYYCANERQNRPHWKRFKLQGENRFLVKIHEQTEQKKVIRRPDGTEVEFTTQLNDDRHQNEASTGTVIALSPMTEEARKNYPDVKIGCNIQVVPLTWTWFYGPNNERLATGTLEYIIAVYDWKSQKTLEEEAAQEEAEHRAHLAKYYAERSTAYAKRAQECEERELRGETVGTGVGIIIK